MIIDCSCFLSFPAHLFHKTDIRLQTFLQVTAQGMPIIHLGIDINGPVAAPGRTQLPAPDSLQIGRQAPFPGGRNEQVSPILEIQGVKSVIRFPFLQPLQTFVRGKRFLFSQIQLHFIINLAVIPDMLFLQGFIICIFPCCLPLHSRKHQYAAGGFRDMELVSLFCDTAVAVQHTDRRLHMHSPGSLDDGILPQGDIRGIHMLRALSRNLQRTVFRLHRNAQPGVKGCSKTQDRFVRRKPDKNSLCRVAGKIFPFIFHSAAGVGNPGHRTFQIQLPPVCLCVFPTAAFPGKLQQQIPQGQIGLVVFSKHIILNQPFRFLVFPGKNKPAHFLQAGRGLFVILILIIARPQAFFIQSQDFLPDASHNHGPEAAVSDRQALFLAPGAFLIPKQHILHFFPLFP